MAGIHTIIQLSQFKFHKLLFSDWDSNQPSDNGDCVILGAASGGWDVTSCSESLPVIICEFDAVTSTENQGW